MPRPSQRGQTFGVVPGLAPVPWQVGQVVVHRHRQRDLRAGDRLVEGDRDLRFEVAAALGRAARRRDRGAAARPRRPAEQVGEDVAHVEASKSKLPKPPKPPPGPRAGRERAGAAVVLLALVGVAEHVVGLGDLLEALLGLLVVGVAVGVVLARELAVGLLDLLGSRLLVDAERLVVVGARCHVSAPWAYAATTTRAGRMTLLAEPVAGLVDLDDGAARGALDRLLWPSPRAATGRTVSPAGENDSMPTRASASLSSARTRRTPSSSGSSWSARRPSARSRLSSAGSSSLASFATPRSCAGADSRATRLR